MSLPLLASVCLLAVTLGYIVKCWLSPFGNCRKCNGMGYELKTDRKGRLKRGKDCRRCHTTGKRIRVGRWIYNRAARTYRAGTR
ncbi:hypothetical protein ADK70_16510 [Streptomyces rimosus subsp. pseudoverticillatus]|uniref:hypothetical protein n=1 Tax=Streptomyces rimosus TaxID=1927 RepID=UPI0006B28CB3|nr:hypothetical protein [Streptomyces rimosus]KOT92087.1 hypothetical protein ADK70_16510 [Streptomyces rimosus subsp. pseudoverticillatus]